ncbi:MAG: hypothetical protein ACRDL5_19275 [Solirubrobacteraceae bacterium]
MRQHELSRTLVKSTPELWAECSDAAALARHLGCIGEIRITRLEPETIVAWEGAAACGTVELAPAGWGTRVTLKMTARAQPPDACTPESAPPDPASPESAAPESEAAEPAEQAPTAASSEPPDRPASATLSQAATESRPRGLARLLARLRSRPVEREPEPAERSSAVAQPAPQAATVDDKRPEPLETLVDETLVDEPPVDELLGEGALAAALDSLGRAHHRPFSRA